MDTSVSTGGTGAFLFADHLTWALSETKQFLPVGKAFPVSDCVSGSIYLSAGWVNFAERYRYGDCIKPLGFYG
jgi:hypothetical protein